jgi:hypothetical protein
VLPFEGLDAVCMLTDDKESLEEANKEREDHNGGVGAEPADENEVESPERSENDEEYQVDELQDLELRCF